MDLETIWRAKTIVKRGEIIPDPESTSTNLHFKVKQRSGEWCDVWYFEKKGVWLWSCNAIRKGWGCVLNSNDKTKPFCSHTLAAKIYLEQKGWFK